MPRKAKQKHCPGCDKALYRLQRSGMCKNCEETLPDEQKQAIAKARAKPAPRDTRLVEGGRYKLDNEDYYVILTHIYHEGDDTVIEWQRKNGELTFGTPTFFLSRYQLDELEAAPGQGVDLGVGQGVRITA